MQGKKELNSSDLCRLLPHRYPMLLLDKLILLPDEKLTQIVPGMKVAGIKNVTYNEPFFQGHFPENPIMPGVLIVEALAQCACAGGLMLPENKGKLGLFTGIEKMKFRRQVVPGDVITLDVKIIKNKGSFGVGSAMAYVGDETAAEAVFTFAIGDR